MYFSRFLNCALQVSYIRLWYLNVMIFLRLCCFFLSLHSIGLLHSAINDMSLVKYNFCFKCVVRCVAVVSQFYIVSVFVVPLCVCVCVNLSVNAFNEWWLRVYSSVVVFCRFYLLHVPSVSREYFFRSSSTYFLFSSSTARFGSKPSIGKLHTAFFQFQLLARVNESILLCVCVCARLLTHLIMLVM